MKLIKILSNIINIMPYDNEYNKMISDDIRMLNQKYIDHARLTGQGMTGGFLGALSSMVLPMVVNTVANKLFGGAEPDVADYQYGSAYKGDSDMEGGAGFAQGTFMDTGYERTLGAGMSAGVKKYKKKMGMGLSGGTELGLPDSLAGSGMSGAGECGCGGAKRKYLMEDDIQELEDGREIFIETKSDKLDGKGDAVFLVKVNKKGNKTKGKFIGMLDEEGNLMEGSISKIKKTMGMETKTKTKTKSKVKTDLQKEKEALKELNASCRTEISKKKEEVKKKRETCKTDKEQQKGKISKLSKPRKSKLTGKEIQEQLQTIEGSGRKMKGGALVPVANMPASYMAGQGKSKGKSKRAEIVKKVMKDRGVSMIEASKIVKAEGLY